jgi:heme/copper-type cytochrome/quinol oxidase subunit 4
MFRELKAYFWSDRVTLICTGIIVVLNVAMWVVLATQIHNPEEFRVLRYSVYFGITDFGPARQLYYIPFIGTAMSITNLILGLFLHSRERNYARLLAASTIFIQILIFIPLIAILLQKVPQ